MGEEGLRDMKLETAMVRLHHEINIILRVNAIAWVDFGENERSHVVVHFIGEHPGEDGKAGLSLHGEDARVVREFFGITANPPKN